MYEVRKLTTKSEIALARKIRVEVFVKEQKISKELELDDKDFLTTTIHIGLFKENKIIGTARLLNLDKKKIKIGRVSVLNEYRGLGLGKKLMIEVENILKKELKLPFIIKISAQKSVYNFYKSLGYSSINDLVFLEAGIEHIEIEKEINE